MTGREEISGGVAESNAPVAPGEVQGSRPAVAAGTAAFGPQLRAPEGFDWVPWEPALRCCACGSQMSVAVIGSSRVEREQQQYDTWAESHRKGCRGKRPWARRIDERNPCTCRDGAFDRDCPRHGDVSL